MENKEKNTNNRGNTQNQKPVYEVRHTHEPGWKSPEEWPPLDLKMIGKCRLPQKRLHDIKEKLGLTSYFEKPTQKKEHPDRVSSGRKTIGFVFSDPAGRLFLVRKCLTDRRCNFIMRELITPELEQSMRLQGDIEFLD